MKNKIQKITPNLWFDTQAEESASFTLLSLKIPRLEESLTMEKKDMKSTGHQRGQ
ncbi:MAG: hypothetical protein ACQEWF_22555 [Bacillota bacterium]